MRNPTIRIAGILICAALLAASAVIFWGPATVQGAVAKPSRTLMSFRSDAELLRYFKRTVKPRPPMMVDAMPPPPPPPPPSAAPTNAIEQVAVTGAREVSITNNQEADVDEGDIVKHHGDFLVVLRRGRLFTISLAHNGMTPIDMINAYPPDTDARDDWYDEMLLAGDNIVVIGYSYSRGGTEINRFHLSGDGHLTFVDASQLRSNDYYSSRNYASRLVGSKLILYSPLELPYWSDNPLGVFPALRHWHGDGKENFDRIAPARQIYIPQSLFESGVQVSALHTVTSCDITAPSLQCSAMGVLGPSSRSFYVSANAVYVWLSQSSQRAGHAPPALLYRLPLDGSAPSAIAAYGAPVDQFSFREDSGAGILNVLVRADGAGDAMWNGEHSSGATALLRLPLEAFGDGSGRTEISWYRPLPRPLGTNTYDFHNRFVGDYLLYGTGNGWGAPRDGRFSVIVASLHGGDTVAIPLEHGVDRIEAMGPDALLVGSDEHNTTFTAIDLSGGTPQRGDVYVQPESAQAETRSHAFFYLPQSADGRSGVIGLPVARAARPQFHQLFENSAAMIYLRRDAGRFLPLGELDAGTDGIADDSCVASCTDWYGNARPIFLPPRSFALLGYELVEGTLTQDSIHEIGRINFAPPKNR
jgi:hypothetical protein